MIERVRLSAVSALPVEHSIFGLPPVLPGEDAAAYEGLLSEASRAVSPTDFIEKIWVREVVDLTWEILRLRRMKTNSLAESLPNALREILAPIVDQDEDSEWMSDLVKQWMAQKESAIKTINNYLASEGLSFDVVIAKAFTYEFEKYEKVDRLIMNTEVRRNAVLREIDRHRATVALILRATVDKIERAEPKLLDAKALPHIKAKGKNAA